MNRSAIELTIRGLDKPYPAIFEEWIETGLVRARVTSGTVEGPSTWPLKSASSAVDFSLPGQYPIVRFVGGWPTGQIEIAAMKIMRHLVSREVTLSPLTVNDIKEIRETRQVTILTTPG